MMFRVIETASGFIKTGLASCNYRNKYLMNKTKDLLRVKLKLKILEEYLLTICIGQSRPNRFLSQQESHTVYFRKYGED